ncbi:hypothetical protein J7L68_06875, partial [bacterium]|nr:hypothetical protein [bacterium]
PITDREYFPTAKKIIQQADKSISISMFVVKKGEKVNSLIEELKKSTINSTDKFRLEKKHNYLILNLCRHCSTYILFP